MVHSVQLQRNLGMYRISGSIQFQTDIWTLFPIRFLALKKRIMKPDNFTNSSQLTPLLHSRFEAGRHKLKHATCDSTQAAVWVSKSN